MTLFKKEMAEQMQKIQVRTTAKGRVINHRLGLPMRNRQASTIPGARTERAAKRLSINLGNGTLRQRETEMYPTLS